MDLIINRILKGDREAEQELLLQFIEEIKTIVRHQLGDRHEYWEDLTNEVCIALIQNLRKGKFDPEKAKLGSYIYGIAKNKISDFRRQGMDIIKEDISKKEIPIIPEISERFEDEELRDIMRSQLKKLKPKYRKVLILRYYKELSIGKIAETLGIPKEKVSEGIYYATELLRKKCQKFFS